MSELLPKLIVGLGNPGKNYEHTRHNAGFKAVDCLAKQYQLKFARSLTVNALVAQGKTQDKKFFLVLPLAYMNNSGMAVRRFIQKKKIVLEDVLVVCDDLALDFGQLRLRARGSAGGHNGLSSLIENLGSSEFARLKIGIGRPAQGEDMADYVLSSFTSAEKKELDEIIRRAANCCGAWLTNGTAEAMSQFNKKEKNE